MRTGRNEPMNKNQSYIDHLIKEAVRKDFENAPEPLLSKEETWRNIQKELGYRKPSIWSLRSIGIIAASLIVILVLLQPQGATAFDWFSDFFIKTEGKVTSIMGSIGDTSGPDGDKPSVEVQKIEKEYRIEKMSLSEAKELAVFDIVLPQYLPNGYTLQDLSVQVEDDVRSSLIILQYINGKSEISIRETFIQEQAGYSIGVDSEDTVVKEVKINGEKGALFIFKDDSKKLSWVRQNIHYILDATVEVGEQEIIQIAKSM
jgi:hypothetical protein